METYHRLMLEIEGVSKMGGRKLLKGLKGAGEALGIGQDKEQWEKTKAKRKKAGKWTPGKYVKKAVKQVAKDVKSAAKGSKEYQAGKAKRQKAKNVEKISRMAVKAEKKEKGAGLKAVTIGKGSRPSKLSPTGKLRKGMKGVEVTEGGAYAKYGKKSKTAGKFRDAFKKASKAGEKTFKWDGRSYSTKKAAQGGKVDKYFMGGLAKKLMAKAKEKAAGKAKAPRAPRAFGGKSAGVGKAPAASPEAQEAATPTPTPSAEEPQPLLKESGEYSEGGKVEGGGMFDWPTRDARNGGNN